MTENTSLYQIKIVMGRLRTVFVQDCPRPRMPKEFFDFNDWGVHAAFEPHYKKKFEFFKKINSISVGDPLKL